MFKEKIFTLIAIFLFSAQSLAHEGHIEHELFGWMHSHIGWEHVFTMMLMGVVIFWFVRKR